MESMGGNGALGKKRRRKRTEDLIEKITSKIDRKTILHRTIKQTSVPTSKAKKVSLFQLYLSKLNEKFVRSKMGGCK